MPAKLRVFATMLVLCGASGSALGGETVVVLVDDFVPQPISPNPPCNCNRLGGDRGQVDGWWDPVCGCAQPGGGKVVFGKGTVQAQITQSQGSEAWAGVWTSLNHVISEGTPLNFGAIFQPQILSPYQGVVTGLRIQIVDGQGLFQVDLQDPDGKPVRMGDAVLVGGPQSFEMELRALGDIRNLNWLVKGHVNDFVIVDRVELLVEVAALPSAERAFLWSYAMLLANWDPASGHTREKVYDLAGDFDNVSAAGLQAAAAVLAWKLGFIDKAGAIEVVSLTTAALAALPRCHGLWPHFVTNGDINENAEWSSIDTIIALVALIEANEALGLEDGVTQMEQILSDIEWESLILEDGSVSHGYNTDCTEQDTDRWVDFGTETWIVNYGYAASACKIGVMDPTPPTFNGSGFIDELAWLFLPTPMCDRWLIEWREYSAQALDNQLTYYADHLCYGPLELFGLSAAEVPDPAAAPPGSTYKPFGVGGEVPANDGTDLPGHSAVTTPHYAGMIAALDAQAAVGYWDWMIAGGIFTPLNNVESSMIVDEAECEDIVWNSLRGSWNLGLQTLGWGRLIVAQRDRENPLYAAMRDNAMLSKGYELMVCPADVSCDGHVGPFDLAIVLGSWGPVPPDYPGADLDGDGMVGPFDLALLLGNWGPCP